MRLLRPFPLLLVLALVLPTSAEGGGETRSGPATSRVPVSPFGAAERIPRRLLEHPLPPYAMDPQGRARLVVQFEPRLSLDSARRAVRKAGGEVTGTRRFERFRVLDVAMDPRDILGLASRRPVVAIDLPLPAKRVAGWQANYEANVMPLWDAPYDLSGQGYVIGMWDGGNPDTAHPELVGRVMLADGVGGDTVHATHIAGVLIAEGLSPSEPLLPRAPAYKATLVAWDFYDALNELFDASFGTVVTANNSWGALMGWWWDPYPSGFLGPGWRNEHNEDLFGAYVLEAALIDDMIFQAESADVPFMVLFPSGDDRVEGVGNLSTQHDGTYYPDFPWENPYFNCINPISAGKNVITVGATGDNLNVTEFSCWGPAKDGRIKPDLVARGKRVYSAAAGTNGYSNQSGTSQATAVVSSTTVLVMEQFARNYGHDPSVAEVKALLINGAEDRWPDGPDPLHGFGLINLQRTVDTILEDEGTRSMIKYEAVGQDEIASYDMRVFEDSGPLKLTLAWIDRAGSVAAPAAIVNDLDLRLVAPGGQVFFPFRLSADDPTLPAMADGPNTVDTVEQIVVADPAPGIWAIQVSGTDVAIGSSQRFALVSNTAMHAGAAEPSNVTFERNPDGSSVDISWDPVSDPGIVEFRVFRTALPGEELELVATVPGDTFEYTDVPPFLPVLGYDVRSVCDRDGARAISRRPRGSQTPTPTIYWPMHGASLPDGGTTTRIVGRAKFVSTVDLFEGTDPVPFATVVADPDGLFWVDHDFGGTGSYSVHAQADWFYEGVSIPSLEVDFQITP